VTPEQIAEDAIWGAQNEDDTRRHIEDAIEAAVQAERARIAEGIRRERALFSDLYHSGSAYHNGVRQGYTYALGLIGAPR